MAKNTNYHRADVTLLQSENARLKEENAALAAQVKELKRKLEHMTEVFANAQRAQFGQSSEKRRYVLGEDQLCLFNEAETVQDHKAPEPTEADLTVKAHTRKKKRTLDQMMEALPVEEIINSCQPPTADWAKRIPSSHSRTSNYVPFQFRSAAPRRCRDPAKIDGTPH